MRIVAISDTHNLHGSASVPDGDVFVHCGDWTDLGLEDEVDAFDDWLGQLPHKHKLVVAGNHEVAFSQLLERRLRNATYLEDESVEIDGVTFYGSPWVPFCADIFAFQLPRGGHELTERRKAIPRCDVLITHSPPFGVLDKSRGRMNGRPTEVHSFGCELLRSVVGEGEPGIRDHLQLHLFGHVHQSRGLTKLNGQATTFANVASVQASADKVRMMPAQVFDLEARR